MCSLAAEEGSRSGGEGLCHTIVTAVLRTA